VRFAVHRIHDQRETGLQTGEGFGALYESFRANAGVRAIGNVSPAEAEARYYGTIEETAMAA
jgi:hypothetical protein